MIASTVSNSCRRCSIGSSLALSIPAERKRKIFRAALSGDSPSIAVMTCWSVIRSGGMLIDEWDPQRAAAEYSDRQGYRRNPCGRGPAPDRDGCLLCSEESEVYLSAS